MTETDLVPVFDGHNDTLLRLYQSKDTDVEKLFIEGKSGGHIDLPRAKAGGFAGGMFAIFPPPVEKSRRGAVPLAPSAAEPLPPEVPRDEALTSTIAMASILFRLERAGALTVCRSAGDVRGAMAQGSIAAVFHIEGVEAIDPE
ncbi:peptidase, partial [Mesorhizobium sp. M7A.T.Ca.TU.009.01.3.2]